MSTQIMVKETRILHRLLLQKLNSMIKNNLILIFTMMLLSNESSALSITWFGTSSFLLEGDKSSILFDPFLTRPSKLDLLFFKKLKSDSELISKWLPIKKRKQIKGIFVSHSHYDHILDIGEVQKGTQAQVFGSNSTLRIARASGIKESFLTNSTTGDVLKLGEFEVEILPAVHPPHLFNLTLASGEVAKDFVYPSSAFSYKMGEVFSYIIKYKGKNIFFNASSSPVLKKKIKIDLMIQGLTFKDHYNDLIQKQIIPSQTKLVMPAHHDDFFNPLNEKMELINSADIKEFKALLPKGVEFVDLEYGKAVKVFSEL